MKTKSKLGRLEQRKLQIAETIEYTKKLKQTVQDYEKKLEQSYRNGNISYLEYKRAQRDVLKGRSAEQWLKYYDQCIGEYQKQYEKCDEVDRKFEYGKVFIFVAMALVVVSLIGFGGYTGYTILNENLTEDYMFVTENITEDVTAPEYTSGSENNESAGDIGEAGVPEEDILLETTSQGAAKVGEPVVWTRRIVYSVEHEETVVELPGDSTLIGVNKVVDDEEQDVTLDKVKVNESGSLIDASQTNLVSSGSSTISSITGFVTAGVEEEDNITLVIQESASEIIVEYATEAPQIIEEDTEFGKRIVVSSDTHYENITTNTTIYDSPEEAIRLYWIVNETKIEHPFTANDTDNDGLIEEVEWITPHLSNETFEIDLIILNVQSYPVVSGNWTVMFNTTGAADLWITSAYGTNWSAVNDSYDLRFLEIRCGDVIRNYTWVNNSVYVGNYSCVNATGNETVKEITSGTHTLEFTFGNITKYAYNDADPCPNQNEDLVISSKTVWDNTNYTCNSITVNSTLIINSTGAGNTTINITAGTINITSTGVITASGTGFIENQGPGRPTGANSDQGAGYGGSGGRTASGTEGPQYGSIKYPLQMGSGGNSGAAGQGRGGGAIVINATNLIVDGRLDVNASVCSEGGGSGGSIFINVTTLSGSGMIDAQGRGSAASGDGGGSGGRIAIYYNTSSFTGTFNLTGGRGVSTALTSDGGAGTLYLKNTNQNYGELIIDNSNRSQSHFTEINSTFLTSTTLDKLNISRYAKVLLTTPLTVNQTELIIDMGCEFYQNADFYADNLSMVSIGGTMIVTNNYTFNWSASWTLNNGANISHQFNPNNTRLYVLNITAKNFTMNSGAKIDLAGTGYAKRSGVGVGYGASGGGSYGGEGGYSGKFGKVYGSLTGPIDIGSSGNTNSNVAVGGGAIFLNITDTAQINSTITANGSRSTGAAGSGGSIYIIANTLNGNGSLWAIGGTSLINTGYGGGGGGRIALYYNTSTFNGNINASGGESKSGGAYNGNQGSIFVCQYTTGIGCTSYDNLSVMVTSTNTTLNITLYTNYSLNASISINKTMNVSFTSKSVNWTDESNNLSVTGTHGITGLDSTLTYQFYDNATIMNSSVAVPQGQAIMNNYALTGTRSFSLNNASHAAASVIGITLDDSSITFGSGYYDPSCSTNYADLNSNTSKNCWVNMTEFMTSEDVHLITNNGTVNANVTARIQGVADAEEVFCGSAQGCTQTNVANITISAADNEAQSCAGLRSNQVIMDYQTNNTAAVCNSLGYGDVADQIKTWIRLFIPKDTTSGAKQITIVYEAIAA
jgi:hypothetical protein